MAVACPYAPLVDDRLPRISGYEPAQYLPISKSGIRVWLKRAITAGKRSFHLITLVNRLDAADLISQNGAMRRTVYTSIADAAARYLNFFFWRAGRQVVGLVIDGSLARCSDLLAGIDAIDPGSSKTTVTPVEWCPARVSAKPLRSAR